MARFGQEVVRADGGLDRAVMRRRVFADPLEKQALEAILHPLIRAESDRRCAAATAPLRDSGRTAAGRIRQLPRARCDRILVVDCDPEVQVARVMARSALPESEVRVIIATQATRAARLAVADDVIDNSGAPAALSGQVDALHHVSRRRLDQS